jgi:site-specific recombinase XerD
MKLNDAINEFLTAQEADGSSSATLKWYRSLLNNLYKSSLINNTLEKITTNECRAFIIYARNTFSDDTAHGHIRAMHKFFKWCAVEYDIKNPMRNVKYPAPPKRSVATRTASTTDIVKMFDAIGDDSIGKRNKAILAMLVDTGARSGGICGITMDDLDMERKRALVIEKGNKSRYLFFSEFTKIILEMWLQERGNSAYLFYNMDTLEALTPSGLHQIFKRLKAKLGIKGRTNPHAFRHAFSRSYLMNGGDLATLRRLLGHARITTTADYYALFSIDEIADAHSKFSPIQALNLDIEK